MFTTYILRNKSSGRHYIGTTNNVNRRIVEHNLGQTKSTRYGKGRWVLIYKEVFTSYKVAHKRELQIKSYKGGNGFKKLIEEN